MKLEIYKQTFDHHPSIAEVNAIAQNGTLCESTTVHPAHMQTFVGDILEREDIYKLPNFDWSAYDYNLGWPITIDEFTAIISPEDVFALLPEYAKAIPLGWDAYYKDHISNSLTFYLVVLRYDFYKLGMNLPQFNQSYLRQHH